VKYQVIYEESVVKEDLPSLDGSNRRRVIKEAGEKLSNAPEQYGRPLRGKLRGFRRLRVGDYRVIYKVDRKKGIVLIVMVIHRGSKYKGVEQRIFP
jgi:mRNA interferase RelE/StbE